MFFGEEKMNSTIAIAAALVSIAVFGASSSAQAETTIRLHTWASPKHLINSEILPAWKAAVEKATNGRVKVVISYPPKMPPPRVFDRVAAGITDVGWSLHAYTPGRFKLAEIAELPFWNAKPSQLAMAHWRTHYKYFVGANEHRGVKLLAFMSTNSGVFQTKFPVTKLADLEGKKFRVSGGIAKEVATRLGIVPVGAPGPKVYSMLQQGVVDGVFMPPETASSFRLAEVTEQMTLVPEGLYYSSFYIIMNQAKFDGFSKQDQDALMSVSGEALVKAASVPWDNANSIGFEAAKKHNVNVVTPSAGVQFELRARLGSIRDDWAAAVDEKGISGKAALDYFGAQIEASKGN
jgi:TRAP-type C4-dicarboxylate transport system substrate-binding protein